MRVRYAVSAHLINISRSMELKTARLTLHGVRYVPSGTRATRAIPKPVAKATKSGKAGR